MVRSTAACVVIDKQVKSICRREGRLVAAKQPKRGRLFLNDGWHVLLSRRLKSANVIDLLVVLMIIQRALGHKCTGLVPAAAVKNLLKFEP